MAKSAMRNVYAKGAQARANKAGYGELRKALLSMARKEEKASRSRGASLGGKGG